MTLTDDEWVARVEAATAHWRARNAAFLAAASRIEVDPVHEAVTARFDGNGSLQDLYIEPSAMSRYTNTELEKILTEALRNTRTQLYAQLMDVFATYLAPDHPGFDPDVLGEPYVDLPG